MKLTKLLKIILLLLGILPLIYSCNFVGKELQQDRSLASYRYRADQLADSVVSVKDRIASYKAMITEISDDKYLITPRKKNKLLSEIYYILSSEYYEVDSLQDALDSNTLSIAFDKTNQYAHYSRGVIYQELGKDSLAIEDYSSAILFDDKFVDSYYNRGLLYEKRTDFQLAVEDYSKAISLNPSYISGVYNNRGNIYQLMKFYDKALEDYNSALAKDSTLAIVYCNRGDVYAKNGQAEKAISDYKKALVLDSTNLIIVNHVSMACKEFLAKED